MIKNILMVSFCIVVISIKSSDELNKDVLQIPVTAQQDRGSMTNLYSPSPENRIAFQSKENLSEDLFLEEGLSSDEELIVLSKNQDEKDNFKIKKRRHAVTSQSSILQKWKELNLSLDNSSLSEGAPKSGEGEDKNKFVLHALSERHSSLNSSSNRSQNSSPYFERTQSDLGKSSSENFFKPIEHRSDSCS